MKSFDIIVIGSGSGLEISAEAADRGLSVAVVEDGPFGGTCLNRGCIPSKMLIHCADVMETVRNAGAFGVNVTVEGVDWRRIIDRAFEEIDEETAAIEEGNREAPTISVYRDTARFVGPKTLEVGGERITAETVVIAAGTRPFAPDIPGLADVPYVTSNEVLRLPSQPRRLTIVGGGFIAAEMAHSFGALGTEVTIVHRGPTLLRSEDRDIARVFTEVYRHKHRVLLEAHATRASMDEEGIALDLLVAGESQRVVGDTLLMAVGRVSNADRLGVSETGVAVNERGFIETDEYLETSVPGVWALGDIVGRYLLKHNANLEASHVAHNVFNPHDKVPVDYHAMPAAIFASPQVASVGLTEQEALRDGVHYVTAAYDYADTAYGSSIEDRDGFVKVLANPETEEVLGCHIIGSHASVLIQEVANVMRMRLGAEAITQSIYVHPALPEVVQRAFGALQAAGHVH